TSAARSFFPPAACVAVGFPKAGQKNKSASSAPIARVLMVMVPPDSAHARTVLRRANDTLLRMPILVGSPGARAGEYQRAMARARNTYARRRRAGRSGRKERENPHPSLREGW